MKAVYAAGSANVGDELNEWIWPALLGDIQRDNVALLGIGTLLNEHFCRRLENAEKIMVLGTGAGYGTPPALDGRWRFHAVSGLRTAQRLGLEADLAIADSAYLLASLDWNQVCEQAGVRFVSPLLPAPEFMSALTDARLVLTEAMHGGILADIVQVPCNPACSARMTCCDCGSISSTNGSICCVQSCRLAQALGYRAMAWLFCAPFDQFVLTLLTRQGNRPGATSGSAADL